MLRRFTHTPPMHANGLLINLTDQGVLAVEDLCDLFECGSSGLDVEEIYEDKLECDPALL